MLGKYVRDTHLIHMENEVQLTDILKAFVQCFNKYLKWDIFDKNA